MTPDQAVELGRLIKAYSDAHAAWSTYLIRKTSGQLTESLAITMNEAAIALTQYILALTEKP